MNLALFTNVLPSGQELWICDTEQRLQDSLWEPSPWLPWRVPPSPRGNETESPEQQLHTKTLRAQGLRDHPSTSSNLKSITPANPWRYHSNSDQYWHWNELSHAQLSLIDVSLLINKLTHRIKTIIAPPSLDCCENYMKYSVLLA